ncbi:MAG: isopentenyl-diphosphate Delta-isomerase [Oscillospiraceae bacterium]|nr:isopentenyl-diphosphate Delta-isomerase [Oscillospiraceae bacterium]
MDEVLLVDLDDRELGRCEKMEAHRMGLLHRAFSVFLFQGDCVLLQKRASGKYHCGGLWTNTCCSHPRQGETVHDAAARRLMEEMGINAPALKEAAAFVYRYPFPNGLTEFELDHVLVDEYYGGWAENPEEVEAVQWAPLAELKENLAMHPEHYTPWFITALGLAIQCR